MDWYKSQDDFEGMVAVATATAMRPELEHFSAYCRLREQGLRHEAFRRLDEFLAQAETWPLPQRTAFVHWILMVKFEYPRLHDLIPHPLFTRLVEPTLQEWREEEPHNSTPWRWLGWVRAGGYSSDDDDLRKAIELNKEEQIARVMLLRRLINYVNYSLHHPPHIFIGEPDEELASLNEAERLLQELPNDTEQERLTAIMEALREAVLSWKDYQASNTSIPFEKWAEDHHRPQRGPWYHKQFYYKL